MAWEYQYKQNTLEQMRLCEGRNSRGECEYEPIYKNEERPQCKKLKGAGNCPIVTRR